MKRIPILVLVLIFKIFKIVLAIDINLSLVGNIFISNDRLSCIRDGFNEYSKRNNLNIHLETLFYTSKNSTTELSNISSYLDDIILKDRKNPYDMFLIDTIYIGKYAEYFEDLNKLLPEFIIKPYLNKIGKSISIVNNKLVSLPLYIDYGGLYYNEVLLKKYNKEVPVTWNELIETYNFIYKKEAPQNKLLSKYTGFPNGDDGVAATLEFIHSFRKNPEDEFPNYTSEIAIEAVEMMKRVKKETSDNDSFTLKQEEIWNRIYRDHKNFIFFRSWYNDDIKINDASGELSYKFTHLPGNKPGISGSCIGGSNIAINKKISDERKIAAIEVYNYLFSYEFQKYLIINANKRSVIDSLYDDVDVCNNINCTLFKNMQGFLRPSNTNIDYGDFSESFRRYIREYIIENEENDATEVLTKIDNILKVHYVEYGSISSIVVISILSTVFIFILFSFIYIFLKRSKKEFNFLPFSNWCIFLFGLTILTSSCITNIGDLNQFTCNLRPFLITLGLSYTYIPFFIKMISLYPKKNRFSEFMKNNSGIMILFLMITDILLNVLWIVFDREKIGKETVIDGYSFKICKPADKKIGMVIFLITIFKDIIVIGSMSYLTVIEWNVGLFKKDIRNVGYALYLNAINIVIYLVVIYVHISCRYTYNCLRIGVLIVTVMSNLFVIVGPKIYEISFKRKTSSHFNINKFIEKTGVFNEDFEKELKLINMEDFIGRKQSRKLGKRKSNKNKHICESESTYYYNGSANSSCSRANLIKHNYNNRLSSMSNGCSISNNNYRSSKNLYKFDKNYTQQQPQ